MGHSDAAPVPVVVFVYGGAWGSGDRSIYCLLALQMAKELNASVICPDYSIYPKVRYHYIIHYAFNNDFFFFLCSVLFFSKLFVVFSGKCFKYGSRHY